MILLTGPTRTGKSTAIKKIVGMLGIKNCGGFYTEEIRENNERVGFRIKTLSGKSGILAHINIDSEKRISEYGVDITFFKEFCIKELEEAINNDNIKYIIIDEIGPMQVLSMEYRELLISLLKSKKPVIGTIFMNPSEWLDDFKKMDGLELANITLDNRNKIPLEIVEKVADERLSKKIEKAKKYSKEFERFNVLQDHIEIKGEHGLRKVRKVNNNYICDCEFYKENNTCSHIIATINLGLFKE